MKKHFYSLFAAAAMMLAVTSCSQEEDFAPSSGEMTTFSVSLNGVTGSRATGDGTTATKLYYQAYRGDELVINKNVDINTTTKIDMSLLKGETYDIIFWAQAPGATFYQIDDLRSITIDYKTAALKANQESYDAFYNALNDFTSDAKTHTIELRRPFAKLNVGTSDWNIVETDAATNENEPNPVTHTSVTVKGLANTLNTLTGEATGDEDVTFALSEIPTDFFSLNNVSYKRLSLNYLLVPNSKAPQGLGEYQAEGEDGKANVDLAFALNRGDKQLFTIEVPNAPVQRNWRTNVVGDLLTGSKFDVVIKPETDDNYNTLEILEEVLTNGGEVTLFSNAVLEEEITIPEGVTVKINLNEKTLKIAQQATVKGNLIIDGGNLEIATEDPNNDLAFGIYALDGSTVDFKNTKVTVADNSVGVCLSEKAGATINLEGTEIVVAQTSHGISMPWGANDVDINIKESSISGGLFGIYMYATDCNVVIDEESSVENFQICGGNATITYAGEKPEVAGDGIQGTITYIKMGTTEYEGVYKVADNHYSVTSAVGLQNLHNVLLDWTAETPQIVDLTKDIDMSGVEFTAIRKMFVQFNGNNHTISNLTVTEKDNTAGLFGYLGGGYIKDLTIKNATISGSQAGIFAGQSEGGKIINCTIAGTNIVAWDDASSDVTVGNGIGAFVGVSVSYNSANEIFGTIAEGATVSLQPGAMTPMWSKNNKYYGALMESTSLNIIEPIVNVVDNGSVSYIQTVANDTELKAAIGAMKTTGGTIVLSTGKYSQDINITVAEYGAGAKGNLVFKAAENAEPVIAGTVTLGLYEKGTTNTALWQGDVTFEGITFDHAESQKNSFSVQNVGKTNASNALTLKNCKIIGDGEYGIVGVSGGAAFNSRIIGCTFINAALQPHGNFGTGLIVDDCTFTESCINVQAGNSVTVQNCNFTNTLTSAYLGDNSFYVIRSQNTPVTVSNCTINVDSGLTDVEENQLQWGILWNRGISAQWAIKDVTLAMSEAAMKQTELMITKPMDKLGNYTSNPAPYAFTNFTVNGKEYIAEGVLKNNEGEYEIYKADGLSYFSGKSLEATINLIADIDMNNKEIKTIAASRSKTLTINGKNHSIKNVTLKDGGHNTVGNVSLFQAYPGSTLNVNNLVIEGVKVDNATYAAVLVGYNEGVLTLDNVDVTNATINSTKTAGVLVGYSTGNVTIKNSDVKESNVTTTGTSSSGQPYPTAAYVARVNNCVATITTSTNSTSLSNIGEILGTGSATIDGVVVAD